MSVKITVSWHFMPNDLSGEPPALGLDLAQNPRRRDAPTMDPVPDRVLPLGSSVVAPGLAVFVPA